MRRRPTLRDETWSKVSWQGIKNQVVPLPARFYIGRRNRAAPFGSQGGPSLGEFGLGYTTHGWDGTTPILIRNTVASANFWIRIPLELMADMDPAFVLVNGWQADEKAESGQISKHDLFRYLSLKLPATIPDFDVTRENLPGLARLAGALEKCQQLSRIRQQGGRCFRVESRINRVEAHGDFSCERLAGQQRFLLRSGAREEWRAQYQDG